MSVPLILLPALKDLVDELVAGNYSELEADGRAGRLSTEELRRAIMQYGRTLVALPDEAFEVANAHRIADEQFPSWAVDLDLWTKEDGHSDLTLSVKVQVIPAGVLVQIEDLHVL
jgi:hypothetical protein